MTACDAVILKLLTHAGVYSTRHADTVVDEFLFAVTTPQDEDLHLVSARRHAPQLMGLPFTNYCLGVASPRLDLPEPHMFPRAAAQLGALTLAIAT